MGVSLLGVISGLMLALTAGAPADADPGVTNPAPPAPLTTPRPAQPVRNEPVRVLNTFTGLLGRCDSAGWANCRDLGLHYLGGDGTPRQFPLGDMLDADPALREQVARSLRGSLRTALASARAAPAARPFEAEFGSGWATYTPPRLSDWYFSLGTYSVAVTGRLQVAAATPEGGRRVELTYRVAMHDVYDFPPCRGQAPFCVFRALADLGWAAEFEVQGEGRTITVSADLADMSTTALQPEW